MQQNRDLNRLREIAQKEADEYGEAVLLVPDPPAMPVTGFKGTIPYCTLAAHATDAERRVPGVETINPRKRETDAESEVPIVPGGNHLGKDADISEIHAP